MAFHDMICFRLVALLVAMMALMIPKTTARREDDAQIQTSQPPYSFLQLLATDPELSSLREMVDESEAPMRVEESRGVTVFMPINRAFLSASANFTQMTPEVKWAILQHHIVPNHVIQLDEISDGLPFLSLSWDGSTIIVSHTKRRSRVGYKVNGLANIVDKPIRLFNGIAYKIDSLLTPLDFAERTQQRISSGDVEANGGSEGTANAEGRESHIASLQPSGVLNIQVLGIGDNSSLQDSSSFDLMDPSPVGLLPVGPPIIQQQQIRSNRNSRNSRRYRNIENRSNTSIWPIRRPPRRRRSNSEQLGDENVTIPTTTSVTQDASTILPVTEIRSAPPLLLARGAPQDTAALPQENMTQYSDRWQRSRRDLLLNSRSIGLPRLHELGYHEHILPEDHNGGAPGLLPLHAAALPREQETGEGRVREQEDEVGNLGLSENSAGSSYSYYVPVGMRQNTSDMSGAQQRGILP